MHSITCLKNLLAASTLALGVAAASLCSADEPSVTVRYGDLAINTPQGAMSLYKRIRFAADEACSYLDHGDLASKDRKSACAARAVTDAVVRVGEPQLLSVYNSTVNSPLPAIQFPTSVASR